MSSTDAGPNQSQTVEAGETVDVRTERMATGGEAVGRLGDGRVVFVRGALPGELVRIEIDEVKKRFARASAIDVLEPALERVEPPCGHARSGACGGCDWMAVEVAAQRRFKGDIVVEQLRRLGGVEDPQVVVVDHARGRRTTVRCVVRNGRAGYRARRSDDAFAAEECPAAHPLVEELVVDADFGDASEVTIRAGVSSGRRLVITNGSVDRVRAPDDVLVVAEHDPGDAAVVETVGGREWRISARSFFQASPEGAAALVAAVGRSLDDSTGPVADLYAGVGLLGGAAAGERLVVAVESNRASVADARVNLADLTGPVGGVEVVQSRVERWRAIPAEAIIADPARRGLEAGGVATVEATGASQLTLVSCDPASLGRDALLLGEQGWRHRRSEVIDMFPDTSRLEVVSTFVR